MTDNTSVQIYTNVINVSITGNIVCEAGNASVIGGHIVGDLTAYAPILLTSQANIEGNISSTDTVTVAGRVKGNVLASAVILESTASVEGDIISDAIETKAGAYIAGRIVTHTSRYAEESSVSGYYVGVDWAKKDDQVSSDQSIAPIPVSLNENPVTNISLSSAPVPTDQSRAFVKSLQQVLVSKVPLLTIIISSLYLLGCRVTSITGFR